jgi:hypothetical protein
MQNTKRNEQKGDSQGPEQNLRWGYILEKLEEQEQDGSTSLRKESRT